MAKTAAQIREEIKRKNELRAGTFANKTLVQNPNAKSAQTTTKVTPVKSTTLKDGVSSFRQPETSQQRSKRLAANAPVPTSGGNQQQKETFESLISRQIGKETQQFKKASETGADTSAMTHTKQFAINGQLYAVNQETGKMEVVGDFKDQTKRGEDGKPTPIISGEIIGIRSDGTQYRIGEVQDARAGIMGNVVTGANAGGVMSRAQATEQLRISAETGLPLDGAKTGIEKLQDLAKAGLHSFGSQGANTRASQLGLSTPGAAGLGGVDFAAEMLDLNPNRPQQGENEDPDKYKIRVLNWSLDNITEAFNVSNSQVQTDKLANLLKGDFRETKSIPTLRQLAADLADNPAFNAANGFLDNMREGAIEASVKSRMERVQGANEATREAIREAITAEETKRIDNKISHAKSQLQQANTKAAKAAAQAQIDAIGLQVQKTPEERAAEQKESMIQSETAKIMALDPTMGIYQARDKATRNINAMNTAVGEDKEITEDLNNLFDDPTYKATHKDDVVEVAFGKFKDMKKAKDYAQNVQNVPLSEINRQVTELQSAGGWNTDSIEADAFRTRKDKIVAGEGDKSAISLAQLFKDYAAFDKTGGLSLHLAYGVFGSDNTNEAEKKYANDMIPLITAQQAEARGDIEERISRGDKTVTKEERQAFFKAQSDIQRAKDLSGFITGGIIEPDEEFVGVSDGDLTESQRLSPTEQQKKSILARIRVGLVERKDVKAQEQLSIIQGWNDEWSAATAEGKPISATVAKRFGVAEGVTKGRFNKMVETNEEDGLGNERFQGSEQEEYVSLQNFLNTEIDIRTMQYIKMGHDAFKEELDVTGISAEEQARIMNDVELEVASALQDEGETFEGHKAINTGGGVSIQQGAAEFFGVPNKMKEQLATLTGKYTVAYMKAASGVAISEREAVRLQKLIPNIRQADAGFVAGARDALKEVNRTSDVAAGLYGLDDRAALQFAVNNIGDKITRWEEIAPNVEQQFSTPSRVGVEPRVGDSFEPEPIVQYPQDFLDAISEQGAVQDNFGNFITPDGRLLDVDALLKQFNIR